MRLTHPAEIASLRSVKRPAEGTPDRRTLLVNGTLADEKAGQLERDFGILHPLRALEIGLARRLPFYKEITPLQAHVGRERIRELEARGHETEDALIVLLMRGARIESLAAAVGDTVDEVEANVRAWLRKIDPRDLIAESQRTLDLWWRA